MTALMKQNIRRITTVLVSSAMSAFATVQTVGNFSVLSMNTAGLPDFLQGNDVPGDKTENHRMIGAKFVEYGYDIINVQELEFKLNLGQDFNYHAALYSTASLPYRTPTSGGVPFGSGLNTLSRYSFTDTTRVKWNDCSNFGGADCLTPKGFTLVRVLLSSSPEGYAYVDVYNIHADAGVTNADLVARASNLRQLSEYIDNWSAGNAVIIAGDTNSRYTRVRDEIRILTRENGMTDPWVELIRDGVDPTEETICANPTTLSYCETVDKMFYRSSPVLNLQAIGWSYESSRFLQPNGDILSDHNPIVATFSWSLPASLRQSELYGGPHDTWFSDTGVLSRIFSPRISTIRFRGGSRLDAVSVAHVDGTSITHGGTGGRASELKLTDGETWTEAKLCLGQRNNRTGVFAIKARTSAGRTLTAGSSTEDCAEFVAPGGWGIVGFVGGSGSEIDKLGFLFAPH
ncbi:hypothetical protein DL769_002920 [Monosporascus sp. CRB-8-3]|nr:hypothetical protein DL769_002920 [Monosporascus sp. CRB-8-3]